MRLKHSGRRWELFGVAVVLTVGVAICSAQQSNTQARADYSNFKVITERNIFNPRRYAPTERRQKAPAAKVDSFTLVGTMSYEKGPFAFFEGSSSEFRKVLKIEDAIAGYKVTNIQQNSVKLATATNEVQLAVGMQMRREEEGPWHLAGRFESSPAVAGTSDASRTPSPATVADAASETQAATTERAASASSEADDPVLKRLMQRREQEMNR
jgi:hypothetical protein